MLDQNFECHPADLLASTHTTTPRAALVSGLGNETPPDHLQLHTLDKLGDRRYSTSDKPTIPHSFSKDACQAHCWCKFRPRTLSSSNDFIRSLRSDPIADVSSQSFRRGLVLDLSVAFGASLLSGSSPVHLRAFHAQLENLAVPQVQLLIPLLLGLGTTFGYLFWYGT